jgi:hypothetical protein
MGATPEELAETYPLLYHMADAGSWASIREHGLLSTSALLDLFGISGDERENIEARRRPECVEIKSRAHESAVVRDQKPLIESKLAKSLSGCTVREWYRLLNRFVFFWLSKDRLETLLSARAYRDRAHLVLTIETLSFVREYENRIVLSPMNSGNTLPFAHARSPAIFMAMRDYPFRERAKYGAYYQIVELAVEGGADVTGKIVSADLMRSQGTGVKTLKTLFRRER